MLYTSREKTCSCGFTLSIVEGPPVTAVRSSLHFITRPHCSTAALQHCSMMTSSKTPEHATKLRDWNFLERGDTHFLPSPSPLSCPHSAGCGDGGDQVQVEWPWWPAAAQFPGPTKQSSRDNWQPRPAQPSPAQPSPARNTASTLE